MKAIRQAKLFDKMKVGDIYKVPYNKSRHVGIKSEAARRNPMLID